MLLKKRAYQRLGFIDEQGKICGNTLYRELTKTSGFPQFFLIFPFSAPNSNPFSTSATGRATAPTKPVRRSSSYAGRIEKYEEYPAAAFDNKTFDSSHLHARNRMLRPKKLFNSCQQLPGSNNTKGNVKINAMPINNREQAGFIFGQHQTNWNFASISAQLGPPSVDFKVLQQLVFTTEFWPTLFCQLTECMEKLKPVF